jgi:mono/diheme cytochrome c family protein
MKRVLLTGTLLLAASAFAWADTKDIYMNKCSVCHGPDGAGKTAKGRKLKVKDVRETAKKVSVAEMIKVVEEGKGVDMDAFGKDLSKAEIRAVVDFYRDLAK